jgi:hypothetical protein
VKYGVGLIDLMPNLIEKWEKRNCKRTWNLAIMTGINSKKIEWGALDRWRIPYTKSKNYKKFVRGDSAG